MLDTLFGQHKPITKDDIAKLTIDQKKELANLQDWITSLAHDDMSQQSLVYLWEQEILDKKDMASGSLPQPEAQNLINHVLASFGMSHKACPVKYLLVSEEGTEARTGYNVKTGQQYIEIVSRYANTYVLLHECSHMLINFAGLNDNTDGHGPQYVRVFCELLHRFGGLDLHATIQSAKKNGIAVIDNLPKELSYRNLEHKKAA